MQEACTWFVLFCQDNVYDILDGVNCGRKLLSILGERRRMFLQTFELFLPLMFLPRSKGACSEGSAWNASHTKPALFEGMNYGHFIGKGTNKRSDIYLYFSLWNVNVFIGHHLLCPSPSSLSWWVRRGVQGAGAGKDLIGRLFWPTQVKWNCYCTLHNGWECHFLRSQ